MKVQTEKPYYTPEEYLELEEKAEYKSEYRNGAIVPMAGGTTNHNRIILDFCTHLNLALRGQNAEVFTGDVRLWIPRYRLYTYPDIMVIKGEPVYEGTGTTTVTNPWLILEVLSDSTKNYDQGDKFKYFRSIPDFREYILIDQYSFYAEQFAKIAEGQWIFNEYPGKNAVLALDSIDFQISFNDIYARINFE
ncbi:MAG: Uma2 family endonuclease [Xenococcaceae cyanobacterium]